MRKQSRPSFTLPRKFTLDSFGDGKLDLRFGRVLASVASIASIIMMVVCGVKFAEIEYVQAFADLADELGIGGFPTLILGFYLMFCGAIIIFFASVFGFWGAHFNKKGILAAFFMTTLVGAGMSLAGVGMSFGVISDMAFILCESEECNPRDGNPQFTQQQLDLVTTELAIFDECCVENHLKWSLEQTAYTDALGIPDIDLYNFRVQKEGFGVCPPSGDVFSTNCAGKIPGVVTSVLASIEPLLCTCAPNNQLYNKARDFIADGGNKTCNTLSKARLTIDSDLKIPTQAVGILGILTAQYSAFFNRFPELKEEIKVPIVGTPGLPWVEADFPNGGIGCGLGMSKGFLWYCALYIAETFKPLLYLNIAGSATSIIVAILSLCFLVVSKNDQLDLLDYSDEEYGVAPKSVPMKKQQMVAKVNDAELQPATVSKADRDALEAEINAFYEKHEPSKLSENGSVHPDVVDFALTSGRAALNKKLKAKYNADLDKVDGYMKDSERNIIATKITKTEVEDII